MSDSINSRTLQSSIPTKRVTDYLPKNIKTLVCAVWLSVMTAVTQANATQNETTSPDNINNSSQSLEQVKTGQDMINIVSSIIGKEKESITLTKDELNNIYKNYIEKRSNISPNTEMYIRNILFDTYLNMLKVGYEVNGYKELDEVIQRIIILSGDDKLNVKIEDSISKIPEFQNTIIVIGNIQNKKLTIEKKAGSFFNNNGINQSNTSIDLSKLAKFMISDLSLPEENAIKLVAQKSSETQYEKEKNMLSQRKIGELKYEIQSLNNQMQDLQKEKQQIIDNATKEAQAKKELALKILKDKIDELTKQFNEEKAKLILTITKKDQEIADLNKKYSDAREKAKQDSTEAKRIADESQTQAILKLQEDFAKKETKYQKALSAKQSELESQNSLMKAQEQNHKTETLTSQKTIEELNTKLIALQNIITSLKQDVSSKDYTIGEKDKKIAELNQGIQAIQKEKDTIIQQNTTARTAMETLLTQTQQRLDVNEEKSTLLETTKKELEATIKSLQEEIVRLKKEEEKVKELEKKLVELTNALKKITELENDIKTKQGVIDGLQQKNTFLQTENTTYKQFKEKADKFDKLTEELKNKTEIINSLEADKVAKQKIIKGLNDEIKELETKLQNSIKSEQTLQSHLTELMNTIETLRQGSQMLSQEQKDQEITKLTTQIKNLTAELQKKTTETSSLTRQLQNANTKMLEVQTSNQKKIEEMKKEHEKELEKQRKEFIGI